MSFYAVVTLDVICHETRNNVKNANSLTSDK